MFNDINVHVSDFAGKRYRLCEYQLLYARPGENPWKFQLNGFEVERFVKTLSLDLRELHYLVDGYYNHDVRRMSPAQCEELLVQRITLQHLYVFPEQAEEDKQTKAPSGGAGARPQKSVEEAPAPNGGSAPSLGPHDEPGYQAEEEAYPANPPAQSLEECEQRLSAARERLKTEGYQPKYTDEELRAIAEKGELDDRFVVRLVESKYAGDDGHLGPKDEQGRIKYWSTTFNQAENADTDPKTLCGLFGIDYDPSKSYTLAVVDTQAPGAGQSLTIVPTHKNLGELAKREIKGIDPKRVDEVMTPKHTGVYANQVQRLNEMGLSPENPVHTRRFAQRELNSSDSERFKARTKIHKKLGANQHYTGDGTTKSLLEDVPQRCGVMETFSYDKSPKTFSSLEKSGSAKRIPAKPL